MGTPVVPLVNMIIAVSSAPTGVNAGGCGGVSGRSTTRRAEAGEGCAAAAATCAAPAGSLTPLPGTSRRAGRALPMSHSMSLAGRLVLSGTATPPASQIAYIETKKLS